MPGPSPDHRGPLASRWAAAIALTAVWHVAIALLLQFADPFAPRDVVAGAPTPVQLSFRSQPLAPGPEIPEDDLPRNFTELPPDRVDAKPERADALSNVDSRARDRAEGDTRSDLPRMEGRSEAPAVALDASPPLLAEEGASGIEVPPTEAGVELAPDSTPVEDVDPIESDRADIEADDRGRVAELGDRARLERPGVDVVSGGGAPPPQAGDPLRRDDRAGSSAPDTQPRFLIGAGRSDVFQEEMDNRRGNVPLFGDLSLNTVAWEYAPWLQRFVREFRRNWLPPYAYFALGVIKGHQVVFLEVAPDGTLLRLEVQEEVGHDSLRESTVGNFRSLAPYHPLPVGFPEPTLQLTIKVVYPGPR